MDISIDAISKLIRETVPQWERPLKGYVLAMILLSIALIPFGLLTGIIATTVALTNDRVSGAFDVWFVSGWMCFILVLTFAWLATAWQLRSARQRASVADRVEQALSRTDISSDTHDLLIEILGSESEVLGDGKVHPDD